MSKCKPKAEATLSDLSSRGVSFDEQQEPERSIIIRIPYDALLNDPDVQRAFQGLVRISTDDEDSD